MPRSRQAAAPRRSLVPVAALLAALACEPGTPSPARISEETRVLDTYPFSDPDPVPMLASDRRLYPYHGFEGYAAEPEPREWKVVVMENDLIEVFVLPEVGGKVWGAVVKETGHEFIYRNEVMKFRDIALRGPWTSGGIEFNFGVIGHTPATATPVDYALRENEDGSVSAFVGAMDLPSRTRWTVEIRLPADRAYFETRALWTNPTPHEQPYYNWMTAAAFAQDDLELFVPGSAYLEHSGRVRPWPVDEAGRFLPLYRNNDFGPSKSYHVVGELNDFFGGYYHDEGYGWGHWARYEDMPGQKMWLWALSREGGVWEDLLTDTDGQYVEFQAGRLLVQYQPGEHRNPVTQAAFAPLSASRWTETWFPVEGLGGITDASREGVMHVERDGSRMRVAVHAFGDVADTLIVWSGGDRIAAMPVELAALRPFEATFDADPEQPYRVTLPQLRLDYDSDPATRALSRPFATDEEAWASIPEADRLTFEARELAKGRRYPEARALYEGALAREPWNRDALLGLGALALRSARHEEGLGLARRALQLDAYDAEANFLAGSLYRALGRRADARDAFGWAARSVAFRAAAHVQLAEVMMKAGDLGEARHHARQALDHDRLSIPARQVLATAARLSGDEAEAARWQDEILDIDPLDHYVLAERHLARGDALLASMRSEYPDQSLLELAIAHAGRGRTDDAVRLLELADEADEGGGGRARPLFAAWRAYLTQDPDLLAPSTGTSDAADLAFVFPYRTETLPVLRWAAAESAHWSWRYLLALNLWALDRDDEAAVLMAGLEDEPDYGPAYAARAHLMAARGGDAAPDLRRAVELDPDSRLLHVALVRHLLDRERWTQAHEASARAREAFPGDFNLDLLHSRSLLHLGAYVDAVRMLADTHVLPSENARASHRLYELAHVGAALDALGAGRSDDARGHLEAALLWPESLGQGRPFEPDERLVRFVMDVTATLEGGGIEADRRSQLAEGEGLLDEASGEPLGPPDDLTRLARELVGRAMELLQRNSLHDGPSPSSVSRLRGSTLVDP